MVNIILAFHTNLCFLSYTHNIIFNLLHNFCTFLVLDFGLAAHYIGLSALYMYSAC